MALTFYRAGKAEILQGTLDVLTDDIKVVLFSSGYTPSVTADDYLADITAGNRVATSGNLATKTLTPTGNDSVFDAADLTFTSVTGSAVTGYAMYQDTGVEATSLLIGYDTLSFTPNGGNFILEWDAGANKIFRLA
jgi:hypothetical protein